MKARPVGRYKPELLILAPETGEDLNTLSFVAQLIELGVAVELDKNWRLPTVPPKDLSAYKACCFPDSVKGKYDDALNAFHRKGGFIPYFRYYETEVGDQWANVPFFFKAYGRDVYFWTLAHVMMEGGLTANAPEFVRAREARPVRSMIADFREAMFTRYDKPLERWSNWGDPGYTMLVSSFVLAENLKDAGWLRLANHCMQSMSDSRDRVIGEEISENKLPETAIAYVSMMAELLMERGSHSGNQQWIASGIEMANHFLARCGDFDGAVMEKWMRIIWSESMLTVPLLFRLACITGEKKHATAAAKTARAVTKFTHHRNGLWHHWGGKDGSRGAFWSRGNQWPLLWMTRALMAADPASEIAEFMRNEIAKTYDALGKFQDRKRGIWHLVMDDPGTRCESSASAGIIYCYDRLREMDMISAKHGPMIERAFLGLKRLFYNGGLASCCRGTGFGLVPEYYRTRPMGWFGNSLFNAAMATRAKERK